LTRVTSWLCHVSNIGTKLSHFDMWHNCEVTHVKNKKLKNILKNILKEFKKTRN